MPRSAFCKRVYRKKRVAYRRKKRVAYRRRRQPVRARALRQMGDTVRLTAKNNVNLLAIWPVSPVVPGQIPVNWTVLPLNIKGLYNANRQFQRNIEDYRWIKLNYIAFKVTDICHIPHDIPAQYGEPTQFISLGVNALCGKIPVNVNWNVDQDFHLNNGSEDQVDEEGFAQHPATKTISPNNRRPVSFVWRFPQPWRQFVSTDTFKNSSHIQGKITDFMADLTGTTNLRAPDTVITSLPPFWSTFLPSVSNPGVSIKTYIRINTYLGATFKGRRFMNTTSVSAGADVNVDLAALS